jgi:hypothetical protein
VPPRTIAEDDRLVNLIDALQLVAADPDHQARALQAFRDIAAEIRRGETPVQLLDLTLVREGVIPEPVRFIVQEIDLLFDELVERDDDARVFAPSALKTDPTWNRLRVQARAALHILGIPRRHPPLPP